MILSVNGARDDTEKMLERCKTDKVLKMVVMKKQGSTATTGTSAPASGSTKAKAKAKGKAKAKAKSSANSLKQLVDMGFPEAKARDALQACGGNVDEAINMCMSADDGAEVNQLVAMGFTAQQARDALDGAGGNVERAAAILLGS